MNCPYCGHKLEGEHELPLMSRRQRIIYDAVVTAGRDGIASVDLLVHIYGTSITRGSSTVLRVQIHELNKKLKPVRQRIMGHRSAGYRLVNTH